MTTTWKRLEHGDHIAEDKIWLKHEFLEQSYALKHNAGYNESHTYAESKFPGVPWTDVPLNMPWEDILNHGSEY